MPNCKPYYKSTVLELFKKLGEFIGPIGLSIHTRTSKSILIKLLSTRIRKFSM